MKTLKIATIATAITLAIIALCGIATAETLPDDFYTLTVVVTSCDRIGDSDLWIVECVDEDGNAWGFYEDVEPWDIGDIATLTMWESTEDEEDDEVVDVEYIDHIEVIEMLGWLL